MDSTINTETSCGLPTNMGKPILCVDFDGVIHQYMSPWVSEDIIPDDPVPGALEWLYEATNHFDVQVYSSRSKLATGRQAMLDYMRRHGARIWSHDHPMVKRGTKYPIGFAAEKPAAFLTIDDRGWRFEGDWSAMPSPAELRQFKPWNRRAIPAMKQV